jgi:hypothetical protein
VLTFVLACLNVVGVWDAVFVILVVSITIDTVIFVSLVFAITMESFICAFFVLVFTCSLSVR